VGNFPSVPKFLTSVLSISYIVGRADLNIPATFTLSQWSGFTPPLILSAVSHVSDVCNE
jgi:hypothetical protein